MPKDQAFGAFMPFIGRFMRPKKMKELCSYSFFATLAIKLFAQ